MILPDTNSAAYHNTEEGGMTDGEHKSEECWVLGVELMNSIVLVYDWISCGRLLRTSAPACLPVGRAIRYKPAIHPTKILSKFI
jgi:hypothetical protein